MHGKGRNPSYNAQVAVDVDSRLAVAGYVTNACTDEDELPRVLEEIEQLTGSNPEVALADRGYGKKNNLLVLGERNIKGYIPLRKEPGNLFTADNFIYQKQSDSYVCPEGRTLHRVQGKSNADKKRYRAETCDNCSQRISCIKNLTQKLGRTLTVHRAQPVVAELRRRMLTPKGKQMSRIRGSTVEPVFGYLKYSKKLQRFTHRGKKLVNHLWKFELAAYNIERIAKFQLKAALAV
jgi:transposase